MNQSENTHHKLKYLIIGAGGTGGCIGSYLARSGQDVTFIARGNHLTAMREKGLVIHSTRTDDFTLNPVQAYTTEEYEAAGITPDIIFVCVKYYSLEETCAFINRIAGSGTLVIPILNVFGTGEVMQESCPDCTVLDGCIYILSMIEAPGVISQPAPIFRVFFGYRDNQEHRLEELARQSEADLNSAGIDAFFTDTIKRDALQKFSFVSPMGAAGLYYNAVGGDFMVPGEKQNTLLKLVGEIENLGQAMGLTFEEDLISVNLKILDGITPDSTTSMQRDIAKGGSSEIDGLVHRVVRLAEKYGVDVPAYRMISEWVTQQGI